MSASLPAPATDLHDQAMRQVIIDELTTVPAVQPGAEPRILQVPRYSLLHDWMEVYWSALERSEFLHWASAFDIDFDTFNLKGDTLHASTLVDGVPVAKVFTLEDDSGWWKLAPIIQSIAQRIDSAGLGLPYIGGKSRNPLHTFPRSIVLAFYGYPEPQNRLQAQVIINELKSGGFAPISDTGYSTSALIGEREAQHQEYLMIAAEFEQILKAFEYQKQPYDPAETGRKRLRLKSDSLLAATLTTGTAALAALIGKTHFLNLLKQDQPFVSCVYSLTDKKFLFTDSGGLVTEYSQQLLGEDLLDGQLAVLVQSAQTAGTLISDDGDVSLEQWLECHGFEVPATAQEVKQFVASLLEHTWPALPYVSEIIQNRTLISHYTLDFGEVEDFRYMSQRLEAISRNQDDNASVDLEEFSAPEPNSPLALKVESGKQQLLTFRASAAFQKLLKRKGLAAEGRVLLTAGGHVGTPGENNKWAELTQDVEDDAVLKAERDRLKPLAAAAGGALRSNGQVSLSQMLGYYKIVQPAKAKTARIAAQWLKPMQLLRPGVMDHWYLLGKPGQVDRLTDQRRKLVIETSQAYMASGTVPLIDYLSEDIVPQLAPAALLAKADMLISRILISPRAQLLGNQLLRALFPMGWDTIALRAINRDRLVLTALLLSLDPQAGQRSDTVIGQTLNDSFFWGEPYNEVRRYIDNQFALRLVKNKSLATHLLLSGIAPEFLIRDLPDSLSYISSHASVMLKQTVLYIENSMPGMTRLMTFANLMALSQLPIITPVQTFHAQRVPAQLTVDWAVARGLLEQNRHGSVETPARIKKATAAFGAHTLNLNTHLSNAFSAPFATPYTIALAELRKIFPDNLYLESKIFAASSDIGVDAPEGNYSLVELHMAQELKGELKPWLASNELVKFEDMTSGLAKLGSVSDAFNQQLDARLLWMKEAFVAQIKDQFCQLPLLQRLDLEWNRFELFTLHPVPTDIEGPDPVKGWDIPGGPFAIIVSCLGSFPRTYEVFVRGTTVTLRRDVDRSMLAPLRAVPVELPFDREAYLKGSSPRKKSTGRALVKPIDIVGAPLTPDAHQPVPPTYTSTRINAIARTAVKNLFDAYEPLAAQRARLPIELQNADGKHEEWLQFFRCLTPIEV